MGAQMRRLKAPSAGNCGPCVRDKWLVAVLCVVTQNQEEKVEEKKIPWGAKGEAKNYPERERVTAKIPCEDKVQQQQKHPAKQKDNQKLPYSTDNQKMTLGRKRTAKKKMPWEQKIR